MTIDKIPLYTGVEWLKNRICDEFDRTDVEYSFVKFAKKKLDRRRVRLEYPNTKVVTAADAEADVNAISKHFLTATDKFKADTVLKLCLVLDTAYYEEIREAVFDLEEETGSQINSKMLRSSMETVATTTIQPSSACANQSEDHLNRPPTVRTPHFAVPSSEQTQHQIKERLHTAQQIQGLLVLNYETYVYQRWHSTMIALAVATFSFCFNSFLAKKLPLLEGTVLFVHIFGFIAIFVTLWVMGPKGEAFEVFTTFNNYGGWSSEGASALVGIMAVILPLLGADAAVHMSEELRDASKALPQAMIWSTTINGAMGFVMIITFCMVLGNLDDVLATPTGQPFIAVFYQATQSYVGTNVLSALIIFQQIFCNLSIVATASRLSLQHYHKATP